MTNLSASSIDPIEIKKFSDLAEAWWDEWGHFRPLHRINPLRVRYVLEKIGMTDDGRRVTEKDSSSVIRHPSSVKGLSLLDIGCGGGLLCEPFARLGAKVTGIDASFKNIAVASLHAAEEELSIDYRNISIEELASSGEKFDVVLSLEVIEHVADVSGFIKSACAVLKPGGVMVLSTLNRTLKSLALAKIGAEYILRWLPIGTHDWQKFLKPGEIEPLLRANGLQLKELKGLSYNPFKQEWFLSDDISVNYFMAAVKAS